MQTRYVMAIMAMLVVLSVTCAVSEWYYANQYHTLIAKNRELTGQLSNAYAEYVSIMETNSYLNDSLTECMGKARAERACRMELQSVASSLQRQVSALELRVFTLESELRDSEKLIAILAPTAEVEVNLTLDKYEFAENDMVHGTVTVKLNGMEFPCMVSFTMRSKGGSLSGWRQQTGMFTLSRPVFTYGPGEYVIGVCVVEGFKGEILFTWNDLEEFAVSGRVV